MIYNADKYIFNPEKAVGFGFTNNGGEYRIRKPLKDESFYAEFVIADGRIEANVFEEPDGEPYLPFNVKSDDGGFVNTIRSYVDDIFEEIVQHCFTLADIKSILLDYTQQKYGTVPEAPWEEYEEYHTLNTEKKHKWYGLFMLIPYKYLGVEKEGKIHVLNLKMRTEDIAAVIDNIHFFPAYHMNKKHWISILLDKTSDVEFIKKLLDDSYALVEGKR